MYTKIYVNSQQDRRIRPKFRILYAKKDTGLKKAHHFRCWECWLISDMQLSFISHNLTLRKSHMVAGQNLFPRSISAKSDFQRKLNCWLSRPRPAPLLVFSPFCFVVYFPEMRPDKLFQFLFEVLFLISSLHFCLHHRGSSSSSLFFFRFWYQSRRYICCCKTRASHVYCRTLAQACWQESD